MTFRQFEAFAAVARHKNVTKAARELHISQPSISKQLKALECDYKTRLFSRSGRGVKLTTEGAELLRLIEPILVQLKVIERRFVKDPITRVNPLKVGGTYVLSATFLPVLLKTFHERYAEVPVVLRTNPTTVLKEMVIKGTLELALISAPADESELVAEECRPLKLVAFAAKDYRLPSDRDLTLATLSELPLIIRGGGTQNGITETLLEELNKRGYKLKVVLECESPESVKMAVKQKLGVGILYDEVVKEDIAQGIFKRLRIPGASRETNSYVIYHRQRVLSSNAQAFLVLVRESCNPRRKRHTAPSQHSPHEVTEL